MTITVPADNEPEFVADEDDGELTALGASVVRRYAQSWVAGTRRLDLERAFTDLSDHFLDVRVDPDTAAGWAA